MFPVLPSIHRALRDLTAAVTVAAVLGATAATGSAGAANDRATEVDSVRAVAERGPDALLDGRLNRLEEALFDDAADGRLDDHTLLSAALIACGVEDAEELRHWQSERAKWLALFRESNGAKPARGVAPGSAGASPSLDKQLAASLFAFMHERVLDGGYHLSATDLRDTLAQGRFNCVSSSVLYQSLGQELGLKLVGLEVPGHALARLYPSEGEPINVETTCPSWFRLKDKPVDRQDRLRDRVGAVADTDRSTAREVSPLDQAAMIYYNRGVALLAENRFLEAAVANAKALHLDPRNEIAHGNLLATLNNWSIALGQAGRFADAATILEAGMSLDPDYETFALNYIHVHHQWVRQLASEGRFDEALARLRKATRTLPDQPYLRQTQAEIERQRATEKNRFQGA